MWILIPVIAVVAVVALPALWAMLAYNGLVRSRARTQEAWAQIDVELKRRHDLIPNLVETVRGYALHERGTLAAVTEARAAAVSARESGDPARVGPAETALTGALRGLFAVVESYPDLKAVQSFVNLQEQLTGTEDKVEFSRRYYNGSVRDYNASLLSFPTRLIAGGFGFTPFPFFEAEGADREAPRVDLTGLATPTGAAPSSR